MYLTDKKVAVMGAGGAIGSNMVQDLLSTGTANHIAMYDPYLKGLEGAAEEIYHCGFPGARVTYTDNVAEALDGTSYILSSGGAPRVGDMTREQLAAGNCEIAKGLGQDIKKYAPGAEFVVVIFNPADITGLTTLVYSGLKPGYVSTLAALDSTRLQTRLSHHFGVVQDDVTGCTTYGGHGESMAVFVGGTKVSGVALTDLLTGSTVNGKGITADEWEAIKLAVRGGGKRIMDLRGRTSYQSPSHQTVEMLRGRIRNGGYPWPCGQYVKDGEFANVLMAINTRFTDDGLVGEIPVGSEDDLVALRKSYQAVVKGRDEMIDAGVLPPVSEWSSFNPHL